MSLKEAFDNSRGVRRRCRAGLRTFTKASNIPDLPSMSGASGNRFTFGTNNRENGAHYRLYKNHLYTCINYLSRKIAGQPVHAGELNDGDANPERRAELLTKQTNGKWTGARKHYRAVQRSWSSAPEFIKNLQTTGEDLLELPGHPALQAIRHPNEVQTKNEWLRMSVENLLLTGITYSIYGLETVDGERMLRSWAVPSAWIHPDHRNGPYTGFLFRPPGVAEGIPLDAESVAFTYFAMPSSLTDVWSPTHACIDPARIDEYILHSQLQMFSRGINPNIALRVGGIAGPDGKTMEPHTLTAAQRRQTVAAVRAQWGKTLHHGDPAILDGMITGVEKLQLSPAEMDWIESGTATKSRIFQTFGINPIVVGEIVGSNRAQATMAEKSVADNSINPIIDMFSTMLTDNWGPLYEDPEHLIIWLEPVEPLDVEMKIKSRARDQKFIKDILIHLGKMEMTENQAVQLLCRELDNMTEEAAKELIDRGEGAPELVAPVQPDQLQDDDEDEKPEDDGKPKDDERPEPKEDDDKGLERRVYDTLDVFEAEILEKVQACVQSTAVGETS